MKRLKLFVPVAIFSVLAVIFYISLDNDPNYIPSVIVGKQVPDFDLPTLDSDLQETYSKQDLMGKMHLLNVWATWCVSCLQEHPYFLELQKKGIDIIGINYKDDSGPAVQWLKKYGNPYSTTVFDETGRLGFDLGITGAPETFLVDEKGTVVCHHTGVVNDRVWKNHFAVYFEPEKKSGLVTEKPKESKNTLCMARS